MISKSGNLYKLTKLTKLPNLHADIELLPIVGVRHHLWSRDQRDSVHDDLALSDGDRADVVEVDI